jgi:hypothetical protein
MLTIRHRSASGHPDSLWEFDSGRGVIDLVFRLGSAAPIAVTVKICALERPKLWCHPITRLDGESWRILPAVWGVAPGSVIGQPPRLVPMDCVDRHGGPLECELHRAVGPGAHVILTNAPAVVDAELEGLIF